MDESGATRRVQNDFAFWGPTCITLYGLGCLAAIVWTGFHVGLNDFWGNLALADQVDWSSPASLYNQFFPIGYTILLRLLGPAAVVAGHLLTVASGLLVLAVTWRVTRRLAGDAWAIAALAGVSLHPLFFRYVTTPGADMPAAALCALGLARLLRTDDDVSPRGASVWVGGALLGAAALFRYHALVFAGVSIVATTFWRPAPARRLALAFAGLFSVYILQMTVAMLAGQSPFHTGQAYIFYKLVHGVNWFHVTDEVTPASVRAVIAADPRGFASAYLRALAAWLPMFVAPALLTLMSISREVRRFGIIALLITVGYGIVVASGGSSRGGLPILFLSVITAVIVTREALARVAGLTRGRAGGGAALGTAAGVCTIAAAVFAVSWGREDYGTVKYRARDHAAYERVEALLRKDGVRSAREVFASDLSLYFPTLPLRTPRTNGTWLRLDGGRYGARLPELCVTTVGCFVESARSSSVSHLVLTPDADLLSPALGDLYRTADSTGVIEVGRESGVRVFRIQ